MSMQERMSWKLKEKVSRTSLYRWMKMYKESDEDIRSLVSGFNNCGPKGTQLLAEVEAIIDMIINSYYLKREIVPVKVISKLVNNEINVRNAEKECEDKLKEPSLSTIRRRVLARNAYEVETKTKEFLLLGTSISQCSYRRSLNIRYKG